MITLTNQNDLRTLAALVAEKLCVKKGKLVPCTAPTTSVSVGLQLPSTVFTVTGSPVDNSGTLIGSFKSQSPNTFFAGPASGGSGQPLFRPITLDDLPGGIGGGGVSNVSVVTANGFSGTVATSTTTPAITLSTTVTGLLKGNGASVSAATAGTDYLVANQSISFTPTGDVTGSTSGTTSLTPALTIGNDTVTYAKMQNVSATSRFIGRITAGAGDPEELTGTQATTLLSVFSDLLQGVVPPSGGGTNTFLRADGAWASPPGIVNPGTASRIAYYAASGITISEAPAITGSRALVSDANGVPTHSSVTAIELGHVSGVTSAIQTQLNAKASLTGSETLLNKRWVARVAGTTSSATPTINTDTTDIYKISAQTVDITSFTTNLTGTPLDGDVLEIQITATGTINITWGAAFADSSIVLPAATNGVNTLTVILQYYTTSSYGNNKWICANYY